MKSLIILALISYTLQIDHCIKEVKVCDSCKSGFNFKYYSAIYCEKIAIPFCDTMSGDKCQKCQDGYELNSDNTECNKIHTIENCDVEYITDGNHVCKDCSKNYFPYQSGKSCIKNEGCYLPNTDVPSICSICNTYFYLNSKFQCDKSLCSKKGSDGKCTACYSQFYLDDKSNCVKIPIPYCSRGNKDICDSCLKGYDLSDDGSSCTPQEEAKDDHCNIYAKGSTEVCSFCKTGYIPNEQGICEDNCANYKAVGCDLCEDGYITYDKINCEAVKEDNSKIIGYNLGLIWLTLLFII